MAQTEIAYYEETSTVAEPQIIYYELAQEEVPESEIEVMADVITDFEVAGDQPYIVLEQGDLDSAETLIEGAPEDVKTEVVELNDADYTTNFENQHQSVDVVKSEVKANVIGNLTVGRRRNATSKPSSLQQHRHLCHECGLLFSSPATLATHVLTHTTKEKKPRIASICHLCGKTFATSSGFTSHLLTHKSKFEEGSTASSSSGGREKTHECQFCNKLFSNASILAVHVRSHTGEKPFSCNYCEKSFSTSSGLNEHTMTHTGFRPFQCELCLKTFPKASRLASHMIRHRHAEAELSRVYVAKKSAECSVCGKSFANKKSVTKHMLVHTNERRYACSICGKRFKQQSHVMQHMYTHTDRGLYECVTCLKTYKRTDHLVEHTRAHDGDGGHHFLCGVCNRLFTADDLISHFRNRHVDNKPFVCRICGASFSRKFDYTRHMRERVGH